jgi:hypothetical protein
VTATHGGRSGGSEAVAFNRCAVNERAPALDVQEDARALHVGDHARRLRLD